jgi:hypothetical protein
MVDRGCYIWKTMTGATSAGPAGVGDGGAARQGARAWWHRRLADWDGRLLPLPVHGHSTFFDLDHTLVLVE